MTLYLIATLSSTLSLTPLRLSLIESADNADARAAAAADTPATGLRGSVFEGAAPSAPGAAAAEQLSPNPVADTSAGAAPSAVVGPADMSAAGAGGTLVAEAAAGVAVAPVAGSSVADAAQAIRSLVPSKLSISCAWVALQGQWPCRECIT
jgi:hypothetical protein